MLRPKPATQPKKLVTDFYRSRKSKMAFIVGYKRGIFSKPVKNYIGHTVLAVKLDAVLRPAKHIEHFQRAGQQILFVVLLFSLPWLAHFLDILHSIYTVMKKLPLFRIGVKVVISVAPKHSKWTDDIHGDHDHGAIPAKKAQWNNTDGVLCCVQEFDGFRSAAALFRKLRFQQLRKRLHIVSELFQHLSAALLLDIMFSL